MSSACSYVKVILACKNQKHVDMAKQKAAISPDRVALYERHIAAHPVIERKGAAIPYTSVNGHMFSCLNKIGDLGLRLSKSDREKFLGEHSTTLFVSYNTVMKEYVVVPDTVLADDQLFQFYLNRSYDYVTSLKPKPTTRKAKK